MLRAATVYGDSVLKGVTLEGDKYVVNKAPEEAFAQESGAAVRNLSRFGFTVEKGLALVEKDLALHGAPEGVTLVEFGGNDSDYCWEEIAADPESWHDCRTPLLRFREAYAALLQTLCGAGARPVAATLIPIDAERYFRWFSRKGLNKENLLRWLGDVQVIYRWQEKYSLTVRDVAARMKVPLLDLRGAFLEHQDLRTYLSEDGIHPSRRGQELIWRTVAERLPALNGKA